MNIDELISKYLDGELSEQEDAALRAEMSDDPLKKADFDDAIFMHYTLKEDAKNLKVPEDLKRNTQDLVLMKIMNEQPKILKLQKRKRVVARLSYSVAAVLMFGFALISEFPALKHYNQLYTYQAMELINNSSTNADSKISPEQSIDKSNRKVNKALNSSNDNKIEKSKSMRIKSVISNSAENMLAAKDAFRLLAPKSVTESEQTTALAYSETEQIDKDHATNASESINKDSQPQRLASAIEILKESDSDNKVKNNINSNSINSFSQGFAGTIKPEPMRYSGSENLFEQYADMQTMNPGIELTSILGGNLGNNVFKNKESKFSTGFSQSLGYRISLSHKFGFEFGYMNYSSFETSMVQMPISTSNGIIESQTEVQRNNGDPVPTILVSVSSEKEGRTFWGSVFYEYRALDYDWFCLDTRVGVGGSKDGLLNLGRITGSLEVLKGIRLNVGFDGRLFYTSIPKTYSGASRLVGAFSIIYGVQFSF